MDTFSLSILAPERRLLQNERATSLVVTTVDGEIEILPGHANLVGILAPGRFVYQAEGQKAVTGVISSGFVNVEEESVKVVAETIELAQEIDVNRAKAAQKKAEEMLTAAGMDEQTFRKYQLKVQRAIIRQQIGGVSI